MCNLYKHRITQIELRLAAGVERDNLNLPEVEEIYPDRPAPIVRQGVDGVRELVTARWGMPTPPKYLVTPTGKPKASDSGVTNVRNVASSHWRRWLGVQNRCLVPMTSFSEYGGGPPGQKPLHWFALDETERLAFFAGIWTNWTSVRKVKEGPVTTDIFAFLTTEPNAVVAPIHAKAMPVILTEPEQLEIWMQAPWEEARFLQRPLADDALILMPRAGAPSAAPAT
jgi:putative SOS response-associated peptidase YedK